MTQEFHILRQGRSWVPIKLEITENLSYGALRTTRFYVYDDDNPDNFLGQIERIRNHVTHQVHNRIRYDNKPVTVWRVVTNPPTPYYLYKDTRSEALGALLGLGQYDCHQAHRPQWWITCPLHNT